MKSVLISIKPQYCELIASGKKTVEVRKNRPKIEPPFKCYIYCTNDRKRLLYHCPITGVLRTVKHGRNQPAAVYRTRLNGKVIGEFVCDKVIYPISVTLSDPTNHIALREFAYTALTNKEMIDYLGNGVRGYGWHISDLVIYDKPKELSEFEYYDKFCCAEGDRYGDEVTMCKKSVTRPPQSWCYVEGSE